MSHSFFSGALLGAAILITTGCAPALERYQYIDVLSDNKSSIEVGTSNIKGLIFHKEMPIRYSIANRDIEISIEIDLSSHSPAIYIGSADSSGEKMNLLRGDHGECGGFYAYPSRSSLDAPTERLRYEWSPSFFCPNSIGDEGNEWIAFLIYGDDGSLISSERFKFELIDNGWILFLDAL